MHTSAFVKKDINQNKDKLTQKSKAIETLETWRRRTTWRRPLKNLENFQLIQGEWRRPKLTHTVRTDNTTDWNWWVLRSSVFGDTERPLQTYLCLSSTVSNDSIGQGCFTARIYRVGRTLTEEASQSISKDRTYTNQTKTNKTRQTGIDRETDIET